MVEATRTVVIPLIVPEESKADLHQTIIPYAYCQQETVEHCWPATPKQPSDLETSKQAAEDALYDRLREATDQKLKRESRPESHQRRHISSLVVQDELGARRPHQHARLLRP